MFSSANKKQQLILEKGKELFWKHGFKRVTVEEVCTSANVSKMTFYKYFANKMELVQSILEHLISHARREFEEIMSKDIPFSEKVEYQIKMKMEGTADISKEFMDDLIVHADPQVKALMQKMTMETTQLVYKSYVKAQQDGHIRKEVKPEFIIYFMQHMFTMLEDEQFVAMYDSTSEMATSLIKFFFYGILEQGNSSHEKS